MFKDTLKTGLPFNYDQIAEELVENRDFTRWTAATNPDGWLVDYSGGGGSGVSESVWGMNYAPAAAQASVYQDIGSTGTHLIRVDVLSYTAGQLDVNDRGGATLLTITAAGQYQVVADLTFGVIELEGNAAKNMVIADVSVIKLDFTFTLTQQHKQEDCCSTVYYIDTDQEHGSPFQFRSHNEDNNPGLVLYQENGTLVNPQPAAVDDIKDLIEVYNEAGLDSADEWTWYIYNGIEDLTNDIPEGNYYFAYFIDDPEGVEVGYSEVFRVCDCEVTAVGDGTELLSNWDLAEWAELANPNNYPSDWTLGGNDANNYVEEDPVGSAHFDSDNTNVLVISQSVLTDDEYYVFNVEVTDVTSGSVRVECGQNGNSYLLDSVGSHNFVLKNNVTDDKVMLFRNGVTDVTISSISVQKFETYIFCDKLTLEWWGECDFDNIIYQYGYRNRLYLDAILDTPRPEITKNTSERDNQVFIDSTAIKKFYQMKVLIPEFLFDALIRLPAYDAAHSYASAVVTLSDGRRGVLNETNITAEWQENNCLCYMTIEFIDDEYPVIKGNCCDDEDLSVTD